MANEKQRKYVEWNKLTETDKNDVFMQPDKYFILLDMRMSEFDPTDIKGLPDYKDKDSIEWKPPKWVRLIEKETSDGLLFFDELNLAPPLVISSIYKIIYDRVINDNKIGSNWSIIGAGNLSDDRAYTHELAPPVRDRGGEVELIGATVEDWSADWAVPHNMDSRIIGYLNWKKSNISYISFDDEQKFTTYRGWERLNSLITGITDYKVLELVCSSAISEGIAREFVAFCKIQDTVKIEEIIKSPEKLKEIKDKLDTKFFVISAIAEKFKDNKEVNFKKIMDITKILDEMEDVEFVAMLWRLCIRYNEKAFMSTFTKSKEAQTFTTKYSKFIIK